MPDSILRGCAPLQLHHLMRFKLGLQNRAFLHFSAEGKMSVRIGACINHDRVELQFSEIERLDSRPGFDPRRVDFSRRTGNSAAFAMQRRANEAFSKNLYITISYGEIFASRACYLCNTQPKTGRHYLFEAVPLLRVQSASVIVTVRRRGASRGRPVLGGSLKSLAFSGCVRRREAARR
jgi:hypothetical protein